MWWGRSKIKQGDLIRGDAQDRNFVRNFGVKQAKFRDRNISTKIPNFVSVSYAQFFRSKISPKLSIEKIIFSIENYFFGPSGRFFFYNHLVMMQQWTCASPFYFPPSTVGLYFAFSPSPFILRIFLNTFTDCSCFFYNHS